MDIVLDNTPDRIVIDAKVSMNKLISGGHNHAPGDFWMRCSHLIWNMGRGFANQFQVPQGSIVIEAASHEAGLV